MKGWRTLGFSLVLAVIGVLQTADWATIIPADYVGPVMAGIGMVSAMLRFMTNTPVGRP